MEQFPTMWRRGAAGLAGGLAALVGAAYSALVMAELGVFRWIPCALLAIASGIVTAWRVDRQFQPQEQPGKAAWLAAMVLAGSSLAMTLPPGEMLLGGWDPGVYLHTAASIADHGSLQIPAGDIARLPAELSPDLVVEIAGWKHPFPGLFPLPNGRLSPQFMHLYPSLMAVAYSIGGIQGALLLNPLLNAVAILLMFWFASKILGPGWGLAAALLLTVNPAQVWQAKFGTAEILGQILLLTASGILIHSFRNPQKRAPAALSGFLFGLAFFTRYDAILFLAPLILLVIALNPSREYRRSAAVFLLAVAAVGIHAALHMTLVAPCYRPLPGLVFPLFGLVLALGGVAWLLGGLFPGPPKPAYVFGIRVILSVGILCFALFVWYVRPRLEAGGQMQSLAESVLKAIGHPQWISFLAGPNAFNGDYLTAIFGGPGLFLALAGIFVLIARTRDRGIAAWLLASIAVTTLLATNVFHDHFMMWVTRRFIPVVIPLLVVGIAAVAREIHRFASPCNRPAAAILSLLALSIPLLLGAPGTMAMASSRDWPGLDHWLRGLARQIPAQSIVFCDQPGFAAPLRFLHGINAHEIHGNICGEEFARRHRSVLTRQNEPVFILTMQDFSKEPHSVLQPVWQTTLSSCIQEQPRRSIPLGTKKRGGTFWLCSVRPQEKMDNPHPETAK